MRIFFISAWKFPQNRPYGRLENKSQEIKKVIKPYNISSDHNEVKLKIYNIKKKKPGKYAHTWKLNSMFLNAQWIIEEIKQQIKKFLETNEYDNIAY